MMHYCRLDPMCPRRNAVRLPLRGLSRPVPADATSNEGSRSRVAIRARELAVTASLDTGGFASQPEEMMEARGMRAVIDAPRKASDWLAGRAAKWWQSMEPHR
jgi:hypothetical protein